MPSSRNTAGSTSNPESESCYFQDFFCHPSHSSMRKQLSGIFVRGEGGLRRGKERGNGGSGGDGDGDGDGDGGGY